jgi:hypothetical protein
MNEFCQRSIQLPRCRTSNRLATNQDEIDKTIADLNELKGRYIRSVQLTLFMLLIITSGYVCKNTVVYGSNYAQAAAALLLSLRLDRPLVRLLSISDSSLSTEE